MKRPSQSCHIAICLLCFLIVTSNAFGTSRSLGTTYLPLDHWAYPVIERAIAKGALPQQFLVQRPWTRTAIASLIVERRTTPERFAQDDESIILVHSLKKESAPEIKVLDGDRAKSAEIENVYTRVTGISGTPLRGTYHFGQNIVNDYGRPYGEGVNNITGANVNGTSGIFGFEGRAEYQHSPGIDAYTPSQIAGLAVIDHNPTPTLPNNGAQDNAALLGTYVGVSWKRAYFSFGRESHWWGPGESSAMLMTNNVVPMFMLKFDVAEPITLPWIFKYLGPVRYQMFMAKLKGHLYPRQPYFYGKKISLEPTKNLEIGLSRTTEIIPIPRTH